ncbi:metal ABC transporter substrate-binding protein [Desulfovibrio legallii]|uniref:Zinc/manganese transport system substrate-binding protein n=1 Tax=Desulfovibrio legallii TaxID=571438 RepID=A0A1G7KJV0_9BACT|nr:metal ABC transporter substrate-binding protein [Desulfovibrio legallii]SDF37324.1 zinc/manganese transport system substrate-binding protein [Desulfovibrio legallii]
MRRFWTGVFALVLGLSLLGAQGAFAAPLKVAVSFSILGDMVKNVGGDLVRVTTLVGPDADTHVYQPSPADAKAVAQADLVVVNGLHFEGWMDRLIQTSGYKGTVVIASKGVRTRTMVDAEEGGKKVTDPHAWQSLDNGRIYVRNIADGLAAADPAHAAAYRKNAGAYLGKIGETEGWVRKTLGGIPRAERKIITSHDAFGYFGEAYGLTLLAPQGLSTEAEASAQDVGALIRQIKAEGIKALFVENMTDPRLVENIARETGARPGGELYADALSGPDGPAPTYLEMFRHNVTLLVKALRP